MCKQAFLGMHNWLNLYGKYILICKIQSLAQMKQCLPGILSAYLSYHGALTLEITFLLHELPSLHTTHSNSRKIFSRIHNIIQTFLLRFAFSVMHESGRAAKKGSTYHVNDVRWTWLGGGGQCLTTNTFTINMRMSSYWSSGVLTLLWGLAYIAMEHSMIKPTTNADPSWAPYIQLASIWCHSRNKCSQAFPRPFCCCSIFMYYRCFHDWGLMEFW